MWHGVPFARQRRPIIGVLRSPGPPVENPLLPLLLLHFWSVSEPCVGPRQCKGGETEGLVGRTLLCRRLGGQGMGSWRAVGYSSGPQRRRHEEALRRANRHRGARTVSGAREPSAGRANRHKEARTITGARKPPLGGGGAGGGNPNEGGLNEDVGVAFGGRTLCNTAPSPRAAGLHPLNGT